MDPYEKGAEARRHIILSHGGKHGASQTYLRGTSMSPEAAAHVPKDQGLVAPANPAMMMAPVAVAPNPVPTPIPAPVAPAPSATVPAVTVAPTTPAKPLMPTNVRELYALNKDELMALASDLGVGVDGEATVKSLRESLKTAMEF